MSARAKQYYTRDVSRQQHLFQRLDFNFSGKKIFRVYVYDSQLYSAILDSWEQ